MAAAAAAAAATVSDSESIRVTAAAGFLQEAAAALIKKFSDSKKLQKCSLLCLFVGTVNFFHERRPVADGAQPPRLLPVARL